ncbi:hypothetical protein V6N12_066395 [Hibiscus sabdariffa]|uniref:Uncharacterized protein n=1 Tax=Hibiscus sabdariffa TaxID=183260 RepID=A0ABR2CQ02_9ROSI
MEPEHEPSRFDDTKPDDSQDSDYNGSSRTDSVTSSFDDIDFSVEDVSQYHVDVEMDFEGHFGIEPSAARRRVKRPFGGISNEAATRGNSPNQHPESNQRASTQPPAINVVRWYMNIGGSSLSQPLPTIGVSSELPRNDQ